MAPDPAWLLTLGLCLGTFLAGYGLGARRRGLDLADRVTMAVERHLACLRGTLDGLARRNGHECHRDRP